MRTDDFIRQNKELIPERQRWCSSVAQDVDGNFYSYGTHYPLLFKIVGTNLWAVNVRGYSSTTGKHIGWARNEADFEVILQQDMATRYGDPKLFDKNWVGLCLKSELSDTRGEAAKHRNGTKIKARYDGRAEEIIKALTLLN